MLQIFSICRTNRRSYSRADALLGETENGPFGSLLLQRPRNDGGEIARRIAPRIVRKNPTAISRLHGHRDSAEQALWLDIKIDHVGDQRREEDQVPKRYRRIRPRE